MFKNLGIKGRVLLLTLLPSSLLILVLGGYFTWAQITELKGQLLERGKAISAQLAPLAAPALARRDLDGLERIGDDTLNRQGVRAVSFLDAQRKPLTHSGPKMLSNMPVSVGHELARSENTETTRFLMPILAMHRDLTGDSHEERPEKLLGWVELELSHHQSLLHGYRSMLTSLILTLVGIIMTALLSLRMSNSISSPLKLISRGVARLQEGRLETRLPPIGSPELDELSSGINRMAQALQSAHDEMQHNIEQTTEDVRQNLETIEIQNIELDLARREALEASRIKSEFLANMSHEIRTPLNGILGFTNLLQKSELSSRQQDYLSTIQQSADNLLSLINEVLDFSKIEAGKLILERIPFNLRDLLQDTLTIQAPAAHEKHLELISLVYRDTPLQLIGDPLRLKQILTNLVSNAIKFTHEGSITVRAMLEEEQDEQVQLRISVTDTGVGLSDKDRLALFQAFSQADNSLARQAGGTGLGLVISKHLVEQMGGEIGVESLPGQGSEFWFSLSLPKAMDDLESTSNNGLDGKQVYLMEAHALSRQSLRHQLEDLGLQVMELETPAALLEQLRNPTATVASLAIVAVNTRVVSPRELAELVERLEHRGCQSLVLCPTTELALYHDVLQSSDVQLQSKPACTRKLQRALVGLCRQDPPVHVRPSAGHRVPHLLCVDDNPANLLLVKTLLADLGAQVSAVDSGHEAVESVKHQPFDLIFMDVQMPGMDGRQATEAIRQWEQRNGLPATPIVALTAHALANERRALLQAGMDDYLTKPINERQLSQVVLKWTGLPLQHSEPALVPDSESTRLPVIDREEGLRLASGKADLAEDMLRMLLDSLEADRQAIEQARQNGQRVALLERVHRLHGATRYCGVPQLRAACQQSETLLKQNSPEAPRALDELDAAIRRLAALMANPV